MVNSTALTGTRGKRFFCTVLGTTTAFNGSEHTQGDAIAGYIDVVDSGLTGATINVVFRDAVNSPTAIASLNSGASGGVTVTINGDHLTAQFTVPETATKDLVIPEFGTDKDPRPHLKLWYDIELVRTAGRTTLEGLRQNAHILLFPDIARNL